GPRPGSTPTSTRPATSGPASAAPRRCLCTRTRRSGSRTITSISSSAGRLRQRDDVAVRVLEPGDLSAVGRRPDAVLVLPVALVRLELDTALDQLPPGRSDIVDVEAEHGEL